MSDRRFIGIGAVTVSVLVWIVVGGLVLTDVINSVTPTVLPVTAPPSIGITQDRKSVG